MMMPHTGAVVVIDDVLCDDVCHKLLRFFHCLIALSKCKVEESAKPANELE